MVVLSGHWCRNHLWLESISEHCRLASGNVRGSPESIDSITTDDPLYRSVESGAIDSIDPSTAATRRLAPNSVYERTVDQYNKLRR